MSTTLKAEKDSLVSALFELSRAASSAASATVDFFNASSSETLKDETAAKAFVEAIETLTSSTHGVHEVVNGIRRPRSNSVESLEPEVDENAPKKRKVIVDPHAPKKPLTIFFAFNAYCRQELRQKREKLNLPALTSQQMTVEVTRRWQALSEDEKAKWKKAYGGQYVKYQSEKEDYDKKKVDDAEINFSDLKHDYVVNTVIEPYTVDEAAELAHKSEDKEKDKKKDKKEKKKKDKKKDKKAD